MAVKPRILWGRVLILAAAICLLVPATVWLARRIDEAQLSTLPPTVQAGRRLRAAIEQRYQVMMQEGTLKPNGNHIDDVVGSFIKPGMPWNDAISILDSAGFTVGGFGAHPLFPDGVYASIDNFHSPFFASRSVSLVMRPDKIEPGRVSSVSASISTTYP